MLATQGVADDRAPVAALRDIAVIVQSLHQTSCAAAIRWGSNLLPEVCRRSRIPNRRDHQMEGIISRAAMRRRIRERPDDVKQLEDRTASRGS